MWPAFIKRVSVRVKKGNMSIKWLKLCPIHKHSISQLLLLLIKKQLIINGRWDTLNTILSKSGYAEIPEIENCAYRNTGVGLTEMMTSRKKVETR